MASQDLLICVEMMHVVKDYRMRVEHLEQCNRDHVLTIDDKTKHLNELETKLKTLHDSLDELSTTVVTKNDEIHRIKNVILADRETEIEQLKVGIADFNKRAADTIAEQKEQIAECERQLKQACARVSDRDKEITKLNKTIEEYKIKISKRGDEIRVLNSKDAYQRDMLLKQETELATLRSTIVQQGDMLSDRDAEIRRLHDSNVATDKKFQQEHALVLTTTRTIDEQTAKMKILIDGFRTFEQQRLESSTIANQQLQERDNTIANLSTKINILTQQLADKGSK